MASNTPQLWDKLWTSPVSNAQDIFQLAHEERTIRWQRLEKIVLREFQSFEGLRVIEVGAGAGTNAALMAKRGARVTILDYAPAALARSQEFFARNGLTAEMTQHDALALPSEILGQFDIAMSFGLTEHFHGDARIKINRAHFDLARPGGLVFISVPNRWNPPYRIFKFIAERTGRWHVGEEYPYSRGELARICEQAGIRQYGFFGDSLWWSFHFIDPFYAARKILKVKPDYSVARLKNERGTPLDEYIAYALVCYGKK